jgi:hypothetical protein
MICRSAAINRHNLTDTLRLNIFRPYTALRTPVSWPETLMAVRPYLSGVCLADRVDKEGSVLGRARPLKPIYTHCHDF